MVCCLKLCNAMGDSLVGSCWCRRKTKRHGIRKTADDDGFGKSSSKYLHFEYCIYLNSQYGQGPFYVRRIIAASIPSCLAASATSPLCLRLGVLRVTCTRQSLLSRRLTVNIHNHLQLRFRQCIPQRICSARKEFIIAGVAQPLYRWPDRSIVSSVMTLEAKRIALSRPWPVESMVLVQITFRTEELSSSV